MQPVCASCLVGRFSAYISLLSSATLISSAFRQIADALAIPCVVASPYLIPTSPPHWSCNSIRHVILCGCSCLCSSNPSSIHPHSLCRFETNVRRHFPLLARALDAATTANTEINASPVTAAAAAAATAAAVVETTTNSQHSSTASASASAATATPPAQIVLCRCSGSALPRVSWADVRNVKHICSPSFLHLIRV